MANLIFDFDGTLVDSYPAIIDRLIRVNNTLGIQYSFDEIFNIIITKSTEHYIDKLCEENNITRECFSNVYESTKPDNNLIKLFDDSIIPTLSKLCEEGHHLFIYTHRGVSVNEIMDRLNIKKYFVEAVNSSYGLKRKPSGEGIAFLVDKYHMNIKETFYIGDREMDLLSAEEAKVGSIFFASSGIESNTKPTYRINKFEELVNLFK